MNLDFISKTTLFHGCTEDEIQTMAKHLGFRTEAYRKKDILLSEGSSTTDIGLVLSGNIQIVHHDFWGNQTILSIATAGEVFAEAYACIPEEPLLIDVVAQEDCEVLYINVPRLLHPCPVCGSQTRLIQNLLIIGAQKNLQLSRRSLHTSAKTIRGRLLSYFSQQISAQGSNRIVLPFNRQQLADYLNLDRSALSKELAKMRDDGLLEYKKNIITLHPRKINLTYSQIMVK